MKILFVTSAHNSLSQRLWIELTDRGHNVVVALASNAQAMVSAAEEQAPDLIVAPMLKIAIPEALWSRYTCLIVHPGIRGDRGPSSLDWAIADGETMWGVTILQAEAGWDTGPVWASHEFSLGTCPPTKSSLYRHDVTEAAVRGVLEAVAKFESGQFRTEPLDPAAPDQRGCFRPPMRQSDRGIDWMHDSTGTIIRRIRAADSAPGVLGNLFGKSFFFYGAHAEGQLEGPRGRILAQRHGAVCLGTTDGALWITHLKAADDADFREPSSIARFSGTVKSRVAEQARVAGIKLPATSVLGPMARDIPEVPLSNATPNGCETFREITYTEEDGVGYLAFDFYNGAMSTEQCYRLRNAFLYARTRPTKVIVLSGGKDFWSNGIHLNVIEAAMNPATESWRNINAIDDLVFEILQTMSHLVIAGLRGNAGAGGVMLALAADYIFARQGVVLNPHYKSMGDLYGSEYWTYTLPRRVGRDRALELTDACLPIGTTAAERIGLLDEVFAESVADFETELRDRARRLARDPQFWHLLRAKTERRLADEIVKPLAGYRQEELARMWVNFFGADRAYHQARCAFVFKGKPVTEKRVSQGFGDAVDANSKVAETCHTSTAATFGAEKFRPDVPWRDELSDRVCASSAPVTSPA